MATHWAAGLSTRSIFGYYEGARLLYAGRTRNGFTPALRDELFRLFPGLEVAVCPFANLPEARAGRWGQGLTAEKMKDCRWLAPVLVASGDNTDPMTPANANGNGVGAVKWGAINGITATLYATNTNNGIQAFTVTVPDTATWDGNGPMSLT